jgi:hypothetical protein
MTMAEVCGLGGLCMWGDRGGSAGLAQSSSMRRRAPRTPVLNTQQAAPCTNRARQRRRRPPQPGPQPHPAPACRPPQVGLERSRQVLGALQSLGIGGKDIMRAKRLDALNQAGYVNVQWSLDVSSVTDMQVRGVVAAAALIDPPRAVAARPWAQLWAPAATTLLCHLTTRPPTFLPARPPARPCPLPRARQVRTGAVAGRVAVEGVMLQYAVDTQLDRLLADVWLRVTEPPMLQNPYPRLMHFLRCVRPLAGGRSRGNWLSAAAFRSASSFATSMHARPTYPSHTPPRPAPQRQGHAAGAVARGRRLRSAHAAERAGAAAAAAVHVRRLAAAGPRQPQEVQRAHSRGARQVRWRRAAGCAGGRQVRWCRQGSDGQPPALLQSAQVQRHAWRRRAAGGAAGGVGQLRRRGAGGLPGAAGAAQEQRPGGHLARSAPSQPPAAEPPAATPMSLQALGKALAPVLGQKSVQLGAYSLAVVPALAGDAWLSAALRLDQQQASVLPPEVLKDSGCPYMHPRCAPLRRPGGPPRSAAALHSRCASELLTRSIPPTRPLPRSQTPAQLLQHVAGGALPGGGPLAAGRCGHLCAPRAGRAASAARPHAAPADGAAPGGAAAGDVRPAAAAGPQAPQGGRAAVCIEGDSIVRPLVAPARVAPALLRAPPSRVSWPSRSPAQQPPALPCERRRACCAG